MTTIDATGPGVPCHEFVDTVTAYIDDGLPADVRATIDSHLDVCEGCRTVLAQWRTVIDLTGRLTAADVNLTDPLTRDRLNAAFRDIRRR